jgi:hypothetical protein
MTLDQMVPVEKPEEDNVPASGVGKLAVLAGLAINLAGMAQPVDSAAAQKLAAERFVQIWGDCVDE